MSQSNPMERVANAVTSTVEHIFSVCDDLAEVVVTDLKNGADNEGLRVQQLKSLYSTAYEKAKEEPPIFLGLGFFVDPGVLGSPAVSGGSASPSPQVCNLFKSNCSPVTLLFTTTRSHIGGRERYKTKRHVSLVHMSIIAAQIPMSSLRAVALCWMI